MNTISSSVVIVDTMSIVANPFTLPVPKMYRMSAEMNVVSCASTMVRKESLDPSRNAVFTLRPAYMDSLMRSKVRMLESTAMPTPSTSAAMPESVNTAPMAL